MNPVIFFYRHLKWPVAVVGHIRTFPIAVFGVIIFNLLDCNVLPAQITTALHLPQSSNISDYTNPISFENLSGMPVLVYLKGTIEETSTGMVASGSTGLYTIQPGFSMPHYTEFGNITVDFVNPSLKAYVVQSNMIPPGNYTVCLWAYDAMTGNEICKFCAPQDIIRPSAPMLIHPMKGQQVLEPAPVFSWFPPSPVPMVDILYTYKLVEMFEGQTPTEAMSSNPPILVKYDILGCLLPYSFEFPILMIGGHYAWQVQAHTIEGLTVGENDGYSEVWDFDYQHGPQIGDPTVPVTMAPVCKVVDKKIVDPKMDGGLLKQYSVTNQKIRRDDFIPLGAEGKDYDQLEINCLPYSDCMDAPSKKVISLNGRVKFSWEIVEGEGNFVRLGCLPELTKDEGNVVIFQPPFVPVPGNQKSPSRVKTVILLKIIDDNPTQPGDPDVERRITIITERKKGDDGIEDYYFVTVKSDPYSLPSPPVIKPEIGDCKPVGPVWDQKDDLALPNAVPPAVADNDKMVVGQWIRLSAEDQRDGDKVVINCESLDCEDSEYEGVYEDNVDWKWTILGEQCGTFVTGISSRSKNATGRYVIYEAPSEISESKKFLEVKIKIEVNNPDLLKKEDTKPAAGEYNLKVYKAGIELARTPAGWLPEKDNSIDLVSKLRYHDGDQWQDALAHMCRIHFFELSNVSAYPGYCTNAPDLKEANMCFDLRMKNENNHEAFTSNAKQDRPTSTGCKNYRQYLVEARTKKPVREYAIRVYSEDYGAYGTLLSLGNINVHNPEKQMSATPVYRSIPQSVQDHPENRQRKTVYKDNRITIPRDIDENRIADNGWRASVGNAQQKDPSDPERDDDETPKLDNFKSDGYTALEEYRGFMVIKPDLRHVRTDLRQKDLFIWNEGGFDLSRFRDQTEIVVHEVDQKNLLLKNQVHYCNFNSPTFKTYRQAGLKIKTAQLDGLLGKAVTLTNEPAPPNWVYEVRINKNAIEQLEHVKFGFLTYEDKSQSVVAHELGHAINAPHHGEKTNNSNDIKHGPRSGDVGCIMRYDNQTVLTCQNLAPTEIIYKGKTKKAFVEPVGTKFCTTSDGTGYNSNDSCFGDCAGGRGKCREKLRVSGRDNNYPKYH
ncbi:MAG TPA: hypothetical protein P5228_09345 [Bacteroidales bacterium]|nr:hypothetical protein [Bacteroidales bacterium]HRZ49608.1 hypothetical protein [Bacteroidales bacterium]